MREPGVAVEVEAGLGELARDVVEGEVGPSEHFGVAGGAELVDGRGVSGTRSAEVMHGVIVMVVPLAARRIFVVVRL
ncbi:hypothetical protein GCM10023096_09370 [Nonomuraea ferruginea]